MVEIGFWPDVDNTLSIVRTITFFPFFVLGYKYDFKTLKNSLMDRTSLRKNIIYLISLLFLILLFVISSVFNFNYNNLLYYSYKDSLDIIIRIGLMMCAFAMIFVLYFVIPDKKILGITKWGKNCLLIFLVHRPITIIFYKYIFPSDSYSDIYILYAFIATILLMIVFGCDFINKYFNKIINYLVKNICDTKLFKVILFVFVILLLSLNVVDNFNSSNFNFFDIPFINLYK